MSDGVQVHGLEDAFAQVQADWRTVLAAKLTKWETTRQAMDAEQQHLMASGKWTGGPADLLSIIGRARWETYHSAMLAWFLDPSGRHGLGPRLLSWLLAKCDPRADLADERLGRCTVATEVDGATSRADIIVDGPELHLVIEVKVDAHEGEDQLRRLFSDHEGPDAHFVFLTPDGRRPTTCACESNWTRISFVEVRSALENLETAATNVVAEAAATKLSYLATLRTEFP